jgi:hypothetical protein
MMTAETKAKRRVTLSICGLGCSTRPRSPTSAPGVQIRRRRDPAPRAAAAPPPTAEAEGTQPAGAARGCVRILRSPRWRQNPGLLRHSVILSTGEAMSTLSPGIARLARIAYEEQRPVRITTQVRDADPRLAGDSRGRCPPPTRSVLTIRARCRVQRD